MTIRSALFRSALFRSALFRSALAGLGLGIGWGVAARVWMRMISTTHEFSWGGTLFIVGLAAAAGLGLGLVRGARVAGRSRAWRAAAAPAVLLAIAPQGIVAFFPAFIAGGLALSGRPSVWPRAVLLGAAAAGPLALWLIASADDLVGVPRPTLVGGLLLLSAGLAFGGSQIFARWHDLAREGAEEPVRVA